MGDIGAPHDLENFKRLSMGRLTLNVLVRLTESVCGEERTSPIGALTSEFNPQRALAQRGSLTTSASVSYCGLPKCRRDEPGVAEKGHVPQKQPCHSA
jgi:hypothetical protein